LDSPATTEPWQHRSGTRPLGPHYRAKPESRGAAARRAPYPAQRALARQTLHHARIALRPTRGGPQGAARGLIYAAPTGGVGPPAPALSASAPGLHNTPRVRTGP